MKTPTKHVVAKRDHGTSSGGDREKCIAPEVTRCWHYRCWQAARFGCQAHPGGAGPEIAVWRVYYFQY